MDDDNWETMDYSNVITEQKRLLERKLVEESDNNIANELFQSERRLPKITNTFIHSKNTPQPPVDKKEYTLCFPKPTRPRPDLHLLVKHQKETNKKHADKFGDYKFDEREDNFIDLEDKLQTHK